MLRAEPRHRDAAHRHLALEELRRGRSSVVPEIDARIRANTRGAHPHPRGKRNPSRRPSATIAAQRIALGCRWEDPISPMNRPHVVRARARTRRLRHVDVAASVERSRAAADNPSPSRARTSTRCSCARVRACDPTSWALTCRTRARTNAVSAAVASAPIEPAKRL